MSAGAVPSPVTVKPPPVPVFPAWYVGVMVQLSTLRSVGS